MPANEATFRPRRPLPRRSVALPRQLHARDRPELDIFLGLVTCAIGIRRSRTSEDYSEVGDKNLVIDDHRARREEQAVRRAVALDSAALAQRRDPWPFCV